MKQRSNTIAYAIVALSAIAVTALGVTSQEPSHTESAKTIMWWSSMLRPIIIGLLSALSGAAVVSLRISWWLSSWKTEMENRIEHNTNRLESGSESINKIPRLLARFENLANNMVNTQEELGELDNKYVREKECELKHSGLDDRQSDNRERINQIEQKLDELEDKFSG